MARERNRQPHRQSRKANTSSGQKNSHHERREGTLSLNTSSKVATSSNSLLNRVRTHWLFGEWGRLAELDPARIAQDEERPALALLISSAQQQLGDHQATRQWARKAIQWGMEPKKVARLLAAGVHNTLGRMAILREDDNAIGRHFTASMELAALDDTDSGTLARARAGQEAKALNQKLPSHLKLQEPTTLKETTEETTESVPESEDGFYRAFEDRFRGSREEIKRRVQVYIPFVEAIAERHPGVPALDLGCGRGEWLETLTEAGIPAEGIDQDAGMLGSCRELGLSALQGDALVHLRRQPDASRISISLMHVVEHIPFEMLRTIVEESKRVLVPDGVLIMETPNPENYTVGSCNFYMDPTHRNPLPPLLLAFVPEYYGFSRVKIARLQEDPALHNKPGYDINDILGRGSPDYAVIAQEKQVVTETPAGQQEQIVWEKEYGISPASMMQRNASLSDND